MIRLLVLAMLVMMTACSFVSPFLAGKRLDQDSFVSQAVIQEGDIPDVLFALEYDESELARFLSFDLNRDGVEDYVIKSSRQLCGSGGCPHAIVDGETYRRIGEVFGSGIVLSNWKIGGWPAIHSFSYLGFDSGSYSVHLFDGQEYFESVRIQLRGQEMESLLAHFETNDTGGSTNLLLK